MAVRRPFGPPPVSLARSPHAQLNAAQLLLCCCGCCGCFDSDRAGNGNGDVDSGWFGLVQPSLLSVQKVDEKEERYTKEVQKIRTQTHFCELTCCVRVRACLCVCVCAGQSKQPLTLDMRLYFLKSIRFFYPYSCKPIIGAKIVLSFIIRNI